MADKTKALTHQATPTNAAQGVTQRVQTTALSERTGVISVTLIRMAKRGLLPMPIKLGKLYLWDVAAVEAALQASKGAK